MSARPIGEIVAPIIARAMGLARLQQFLDVFSDDERKEWIDDFERCHTVDDGEAALLREHNAEECA